MGTQMMNTLDFSDWRDFVDGDGTVSISDGIITAASTSGSRARIRKYFNVFPGDTVEFRIWARNSASTPGVPCGNLAIDNNISSPFASDAIAGVLDVETSEWREYVLRYSVPLDSPPAAVSCITLGVFASSSGEAQFARPSINITNSIIGTSRVLAMGLIRLDAGVPSLSDNFCHTGISALEYDSGSSTLFVTVPRVGGIADTRSRPLGFATMTATATGDVMPTVGNYSTTTGTFSVGFRSLVDGEFVDMAERGTVFMNFQAICV